MIRSMYSGVSGMAAHQAKLNVIGNNIANVNTYGFKASRVVFSDVLYQNLNTPTGATAEAGGVNPSQMGYGAKVGTVDVINTVASGADTGRALDVYINGEGYLPVKGSDGIIKFTRVGNLKFDAEGNLTDGNGSLVLGLPTDETTGEPLLNADGTLDVTGLKVINIPPEKLERCTGISIGQSGEITGIMDGDPTFTQALGTSWLKSSSLPTDSTLGGNVVMSIGKMVSYAAGTVGTATVDPTADLSGQIQLTKSGSAYTLNTTSLTDKLGNTLTPGAATVSSTGILTFANIPGLELNVAGLADGVDQDFGTIDATTTDISIIGKVYDQGGNLSTYTITPWDPAAADAGTLTFGDLVLTVDPTALNAAGEFSNQKIGSIASGSSTPVSLGYLSLAKFANVDGLSQDGNGYMIQSANSGDPVIVKAGTKGTGTLKSSSLEMSNVDLSKEFTEMITAQRGFQANSRIVTVSDTILEELINLKR